MAAKKDYYDILGVSKSASDDELKKAYRKLAKEWHPDANPDKRKEAESKFKEINEAYEVLSNPQKKKMYDQFGTVDPNEAGGFGGQGPFGGSYYTYTSGDGFGGFDGFGDIFEDIGSIFGFGSGRSRRKTGPTKGQDI